jgi:hypothetical protein
MFRVETWICTTLFAVGIIGGMTYLSLSGYSLAGKAIDPVNSPVAAALESQTSEVDSDAVAPKKQIYERMLFDEDLSKQNAGLQNDSLKLADRYLIAGNYALALENYHRFEKSIGSAGSSILLRQALCNEMQQLFGVAEDKYYRALTGAANECHRLLGFAGLARCLTKSGKQIEALDLLAELNLKRDQYSGVHDEARSQLAYQFAKVLESFAVGERNDLTRPDSVAFEDSPPKPEVFLNAIDQPGQPTPELRAASQQKFEILQRPSSSMLVISASISVPLESIGVLLGQIAAHAEQKIIISQQAAAAIENRARCIELRASPLSSVLDQLLIPFDLVWYQIDSELHVIARGELDPALPPNQFWFDSAHRAYRRFELEFDDDQRRQAALLSRANLSFLQNRLDEANNTYQELSQTQPTGGILAKLFFNRAKLNLLFNRPEEANRFLYFAVDQTMNPDVQASGYCLLGANCLSQGDLETSIKVSRRGLATAINAKQKRFASLNLARAYLLKQDPYSANKTLFDNREFYEDSSVRTIASILGAYARYVGVTDDNSIRIARHRLFGAVAMIPETDYQSFADAYIAGLAFEQLGFREQAVGKLLLALAQKDVGQWRRQILFELAILQSRLGRMTEAATSLQSVIQADDDRWNRLALEQMAKIYLSSNQPEPCIEICKKLWELKLDEPRKRTVLQLLGDAYDMKGEHYSAALCFAGMLPDQF